MKINNTKNDYSFKGYVHKSVINLVDDAVMLACKKELREANHLNKKPNEGKINDAHKLGKRIISTLGSAMKHYHPETRLKADFDLNNNTYLHLNNSKTNTSLRITDVYTDYAGMLKNGVLSLHIPKSFGQEAQNMQFLKDLYTFAKELKELVNPKTIDLELFNKRLKLIKDSAQEFPIKWLIRRNTKKLEEITPEFGAKPEGISFGIKREMALSNLLKKALRVNKKD